MDIFGTQIDLGRIPDFGSTADHALVKILKRSEERKAFRAFLDSVSSKGEKVLDLFTQDAEKGAAELLEKGYRAEKEVLLDFAVSKMKSRNVNGSTLYSYAVRKLVEGNHPEFINLHRRVDNGTYDGKLPLGYPDAAREADSLLVGKVKDSLGPKVERQFVQEKLLLETIREYSREMFSGVNELGLGQSELVRYLTILYEVKSAETAPVENNMLFKRCLGESLRLDQPLNMILIKCFRFSYPVPGKLELITHTGKVAVGERLNDGQVVRDESKIFLRLGDFENIFRSNGVGINTTVAVVDTDLEDNFPPGFEQLVAPEYIRKAVYDSTKYIDCLRSNPNGYRIILLTELLKESGLRDAYIQIRDNVLGGLRRGKSNLLPEEGIEDMVDYRFERDQVLFGKATRELARERVYRKISSQVALEVFEGDGGVLLTNSHGNENKLIANGKMPILFADLYDEEKVVENV